MDLTLCAKALVVVCYRSSSGIERLPPRGRLRSPEWGSPYILKGDPMPPEERKVAAQK